MVQAKHNVASSGHEITMPMQSWLQHLQCSHGHLWGIHQSAQL